MMITAVKKKGIEKKETKTEKLLKRSNAGRKPKNGASSLKDRLRLLFKNPEFKCNDDELMAKFPDYWPTDVLVAISTLKNPRYAGRGGAFVITRSQAGFYQQDPAVVT